MAVGTGGCVGLLLPWVLENALGSGTPEFQVLVGFLTAYTVLSIPRRMMNESRTGESREAPLLSVMASSCLRATGSRPKTLLALRSGEPGLARALRDIRRGILLGRPVKELVEGAAERVTSYSATNVLRGVANALPEGIQERGEENQGIWDASLLARETKFPIFLTICFFTPIMLLLYAVFGHLGTSSTAGLVAVQVVLLGISYFLSSPEVILTR